MSQAHLHLSPDAIYPFDARGVAKRFRHAAIFGALDSLEPIEADELVSRLENGSVTLLDVRPEDEFRAGHLPHAINIALDTLEARLAELPKGSEIVAYCRGPYCVLAFEAVRALRAHGYRARRLRDGFPEWKVAGRPVETA